jgi:hypothetical protein
MLLQGGMVRGRVGAVGESCENDLFYGDMFCGILPPSAHQLAGLFCESVFSDVSDGNSNLSLALFKDQAVTDHASLT